MNPTDYRRNEIARELQAVRNVERAPLRDRQEARADWRDCLTDRRADYTAGDYLRDRIAWIANGSYGAGAMYLTRELFGNCTTPLQRRALLFRAIARLDHSCPERFAAEVWKSLPPDLQREVDAACDDAASTFIADCAEAA